MVLAALLIGLLAVAFLAVVIIGAPYVPTHKKNLQKAIHISGMKPGDGAFVDLGSGDGRLLLAAAQRGIRSVGYEINPFLVAISRWRCRRVKQYATTEMKNFWQVDLPADTVLVFVFLAQPFMQRLAHYLEAQSHQLHRPIMLVSYGFTLPGYEPIRQDGPLICYKIHT